MEILYRSTRGGEERITASQAILNGIAGNGGLYVPTEIPAFDRPVRAFASMDYRETAFTILKAFLTDYTEEELRSCINSAYGSQFDTAQIAPLTEAAGVHYLELYHGPTIAFKDMALQLLPHLMTTAAKKNGVTDEIVILTATSGDTGKAALEGFTDVQGTRIVVFYPKHGVSRIQELQMVTQKGDNTCVVGIEGNFDDAQTGVKKLFTDERVGAALAANGFRFSSANSINIGRLVPQIVYYVYSYARLLREGRIADGEAVNIVVPTGNFGNILAAWYAKKMGLPVKKLICASNENKVLYDFFGTGTYDRNREFILTSSPSMDILISSNLERLIYHIAGDDAETDRALMAKLLSEGKYEITDTMRKALTDFVGGFATEEETKAEIARVFTDAHYLIDTHTAVASAVCDRYRRDSGDTAQTILASTASPFKFTRAVTAALGIADGDADDFALAEKLSEKTGVPVPAAVSSLPGAQIRHTRVCEVTEMEQAVRDFLGIKGT
ncbi:MAG: threonine synthase [Lachnospiraceae bacterium]|nr:threonine synthase [Lachnospiraceae bacterium]